MLDMARSEQINRPPHSAIDTARDETPLRIGVLSLHNSKESKAILNAIRKLGHDPVWLREENISIRIVNGDPVVSPDVDLVVNRLLLSNAEAPLEDLELANVLATARPTLNPPNAVLTAIHKYATAMTLASAGIPVPDSHLALDTTQLNEERDHLATPAVQKAAIGTHGESLRKVTAEEEVYPTHGRRRTLLQEFLQQETEQSDVRVYVVDGRVVGAMRRSSMEDDWRANVARGGTTEDVTDSLPSEATTIARAATRAIGLDMAGVDLMQQNDDWYVLEVNPTAGFKGLFDATGTSPAPYIAQSAIEQLGGTVADERVTELASTLDDSSPACKPELSSDSTSTRTIGYTEPVTVNGSHGFTDVIAKADTGADRTSISIDVAADIGAGPIKDSTDVKSAGGATSTTRIVVDVDLAIDGEWQTVTVSVEDRSHMSYPVLLGRDVLSGYRIDVDRRGGETNPPAGNTSTASDRGVGDEE